MIHPFHFFQHCVNSFDKSRESPSSRVGSELEQFCTPRSSFEAPAQTSNCNEGAKTPRTEFHIGSPRSSCADEEVAGSGRRAGTNTPWPESLVGPSGRSKRHCWNSRGGRRGRRQGQLLRNLYPERRQTKSKKIERPPSTTSDTTPLPGRYFANLFAGGREVARAAHA